MRLWKLVLLALFVLATPFIWIASALSMLWTTLVFAVHIGRLWIEKWWRERRRR
ncbi:MAG: hypothetical protein ABWZ88_12200 [Variovorax sp.]